MFLNVTHILYIFKESIYQIRFFLFDVESSLAVTIKYVRSLRCCMEGYYSQNTEEGGFGAALANLFVLKD